MSGSKDAPFPPSSDSDLFQQAVQGVKPLPQDKHAPITPWKHKAKSVNRSQRGSAVSLDKQAAASFAFSDVYEAVLSEEGPIRYCREDVPTHSLKRLRRGDFYPELILDLHGLDRETTKLELAALIHTARKDLIDCVAIVHGIGQGILKRALPHYLVQHPHVLAFHQAPLEYGGQGALLVLIETNEPHQAL